MVFSSFTFLIFFLPFTLIGYYAIKLELRNIFLLIMSLLFYMWGGPKYVLVMLGVIIINYICGYYIDKFQQYGYYRLKKTVLIVGLLFNIFSLVVFKYLNFFIDNINVLRSLFGIEAVYFTKIVLPIGISFYIFQSISYLVDVYKQTAKVQYKITNLALYISLFPQLIAGPIVRYNTIDKQIEQRAVDCNLFATGLKIFIIGLGKKVLIANSMASVADSIYAIPFVHLTITTAWIGAIAYTFQIYFDFSGYSDMAVGLGLMLGFSFPLNFNYPYISTSITEFWRRWHISLSTWFKDYLYIPLGGNQVKVSRMYVNLLIVFFVTGFWHGASWTFIAWGLIHGFFLIVEKLTAFHYISRFRALRWLVTMFVVIIAWVLFRSETISDALAYISIMLGIKSDGESLIEYQYYLNFYNIIMLCTAVLGSTSLVRRYFFNNIINDSHNNAILTGYNVQETSSYEHIFSYQRNVWFLILQCLILLSIMLLCFMNLANSSYNPFIYFRF